MKGLQTVGLLLSVRALTGLAVAPVTAQESPAFQSRVSFDTLIWLAQTKRGPLLAGSRLDGIWLVDSILTAKKQVGRHGAGPGEYRWPERFVGYSGDTLVVWDGGLLRFLLLDESGRIVETRTPPRGVGFIHPVGVTSLGSVVLVLRDTTEGQGFLALWPRGPEALLDTIGTVRLRPTEVIYRTTGRTRSSFEIPVPFTAPDQVLVEGVGLVVVRVAPYRIDRWRPGRGWERGSPLAARKEPVVKADLDSLAALERGRRWMRDRRLVPDYKDPFPDGGAVLGDDGSVWVRRQTASQSRVSLYDVITSDGGLTRRNFPQGVVVLAVLSGRVVAARVDDDGLWWLEQYRR